MTATIIAVAMLTIKLLAQNDLRTIKVIDDLTKKPVKDASIHVGDSISKTNYMGYAQAVASTGDTMTISCPEYVAKYIIVPASQKFQLTLQKEIKELGYTGGVGNFYDHFASNLRYPGKARMKKIQAQIYVEFRVDSLGSSNIIQIHNDVDGLFGPEINRVFKTIRGKWDRVYSSRVFLLPLKFRIRSLSTLKETELKEVNADIVLNEIVVTIFQ
jgi:hypothetical protein